jgi:hypothetical protein
MVQILGVLACFSPAGAASTVHFAYHNKGGNQREPYPPVATSTAYPVYYNVDQGTAGDGGIPREPYPPIQVDVTKYGIMPLNYTQGERACILPGCTPWTNGAFPLLECSSSGQITKTVNGGVPQLANLSLHLELIRETLPKWIPDPEWSVSYLRFMLAFKRFLPCRGMPTLTLRVGLPSGMK